MVFDRLLHEFEELQADHDAVFGMIKKCTERAKQFFNEIDGDEELDDCDDDAENCTSESEDDLASEG